MPVLAYQKWLMAMRLERLKSKMDGRRCRPRLLAQTGGRCRGGLARKQMYAHCACWAPLGESTFRIQGFSHGLSRPSALAMLDDRRFDGGRDGQDEERRIWEEGRRAIALGRRSRPGAADAADWQGLVSVPMLGLPGDVAGRPYLGCCGCRWMARRCTPCPCCPHRLRLSWHRDVPTARSVFATCQERGKNDAFSRASRREARVSRGFHAST
jgi:hypothetical protein